MHFVDFLVFFPAYSSMSLTRPVNPPVCYANINKADISGWEARSTARLCYFLNGDHLHINMSMCY